LVINMVATFEIIFVFTTRAAIHNCTAIFNPLYSVSDE
jgi:hypothetical protein